jgi:hypothetical protein
MLLLAIYIYELLFILFILVLSYSFKLVAWPVSPKCRTLPVSKWPVSEGGVAPLRMLAKRAKPQRIFFQSLDANRPG